MKFDKEKIKLKKDKKQQRPVAEIKRVPAGYVDFLAYIKVQIRRAQIKASLSVNCELILLYWNIGNQILERQKQAGWGAKIIERLAKDIRQEFPTIKGFSSRNLKYMRAFAQSYPDKQIVQQVVAQIPWGHNIVLLNSIKDEKKRIWYIQRTIEYGWSRNVLIHQIESGLYKRKSKAITNFKKTLPLPQSDLAHQMLKDPYQFDFLTIDEDAREKELEDNLIRHLEQFLLELGIGFAFVGRQERIEIGNQNFYIDLLFYHTRLHSYIVVELKTGEFKPEFASKMNFYLNAIDNTMKLPEDKPSIGIILCKTKNKVIVEYALRDILKPIGVAEYKLTKKLPKDFKGRLPTIKELEAEISEMDKRIKKKVRR